MQLNPSPPSPLIICILAISQLDTRPTLTRNLHFSRKKREYIFSSAKKMLNNLLKAQLAAFLTAKLVQSPVFLNGVAALHAASHELKNVAYEALERATGSFLPFSVFSRAFGGSWRRWREGGRFDRNYE